MLQVSIERTQHAVGHGGFHTGSIELFEPRGRPTPPKREIPGFRYVYDCGSEQNTAFNSALAAYRSTSQGHTDILFVSHLHSDHINGIERLQALAPATTVVAPYLDVIERLIFVLSDIEAGSASSSAIEYFADPADWWRRRRATRIVFMEAGGGDDVPPGRPGSPDAPVDDGEHREASRPTRHEKETPGVRLANHLRRPRGDAPVGLTRADETERDMAKGAILAGAGSSFQLEWRPDVSTHWQIGDWILLPYVHPIDEATRSPFRRAVMKALTLRGRDEVKLTRKLIEYLSSYDKTKVLLDLYGAHFPHGQNALSMSLYSGPFCSDQGKSRDQEEWRPMWRNCIDDIAFAFHPFMESAGWLGTGDAGLKQSNRRDPWLRFFGSYASDVAVMTLPHHGSAHNFHEEILRFDQLRMALATTVERRQRVARMRETLALVEAHGISTRVIDDEHRNSFSVCWMREMGR